MATPMTDNFSSGDGLLEELEDSIKMALKKTGAKKELDLCAYLSIDDRPFSPSSYLRLKDTDRETLLNMINTKILENFPHKMSQKVQETSSASPYAGQSLEECIKEAMTKMNVLRATALCKYIPADEGYIHHFTFLKMRTSNPIQLRNLIKEHILDHIPRLVPPRKRKRRHREEQIEDLSNFEPAEGDNLNSLIIQAMDKLDLDLQYEEDLQRYFPHGDSLGHPLVYQSLKKNHPRQLARLIKKYILTPARPQILKWDKIEQSPSGPIHYSSTSGEFENFGKAEESKIDQLLKMVSQLSQTLRNRDGFEETPKRSTQPPKEGFSNSYDKCIQIIQNELIMKVLKREVDHGLWGAFVEIVGSG